MWRLPMIAAYCKVDDVMLFHERSRRVKAALAGATMSVATCVPFVPVHWLTGGEGTWGTVSAAMLIFGMAFGLVNLLPVFRLDGYYVLSHGLGVSALDESARREPVRLVRPTQTSKITNVKRGVYLAYGIGAYPFQTVLVLAIAFVAHQALSLCRRNCSRGVDRGGHHRHRCRGGDLRSTLQKEGGCSPGNGRSQRFQMGKHMTETIDDPVIDAKGLTKRFATTTAVDDVTLSVRRGEVYGFVGLNGAGKTTFMRMLVGLARPTSGTVSVLGASRLTDDVLRRVGTTIERPAFYPGMTGRQNLTLLAKYSGIGADEVEASLETVDLAQRADEKFKNYSLGMKQRLALAAALMGSPELLLLDEPTNGLDPSGMAAMRDLIRSQADSGRTVMLSSHLLSEIAQVCDRVAVIHRARLIAVGTTAEIEQMYGARPSLVVTCDDPVKAAAVARELDSVEEVTEQDDGIIVYAPQDAAGALNSALVLGGVTVSGLRPSQRTLEDIFLEITGENSNGAKALWAGH